MIFFTYIPLIYPGKGNKSIILSDFPPPRKSSKGLLQTGLLPAFIKVL
jgi:hypothetical protein